MISMVIQNFGNSPAKDVNIKFDPAPIDFANRTINEVSLFSNPIYFLPPGKFLRQKIDVGYRFIADNKPTCYSVEVAYKSIHNKNYSEKINYDLAYLKQATLPSKSVEESLESLLKELKELIRIFKTDQHSVPILVETLEQRGNRLTQEGD